MYPLPMPGLSPNREPRYTRMGKARRIGGQPAAPGWRVGGARGFTLIELLIVVAIIAVLAAIAVPNFLEAQTRAKVAAVKSELRTLSLALESYAVDHNAYPYAECIGPTLWMPPGGKPRNNAAGIEATGVTTPIAYITTIPNDTFKHPISGIPVIAPVYYERAGFVMQDGTLWNTPEPVAINWSVPVPSDAVDTNRLDGTGPDVLMGDSNRTPARYDLYSLGPDLVLEVPGTAITSRYNLNNRYDPTNGTVSTGNIMRFPGGNGNP